MFLLNIVSDQRSARAGFARPGPARLQSRSGPARPEAKMKIVLGPARLNKENEILTRARLGRKQNTRFWPGPGPTNIWFRLGPFKRF